MIDETRKLDLLFALILIGLGSFNIIMSFLLKIGSSFHNDEEIENIN